MPYRRGTRSYRRPYGRRSRATKKAYPSRNRMYRRKYKLHRPVGLPNQQYLTFKYAEMLQLQTADAINFGKAVYSMNSLYDPQVSTSTNFLSVTGHVNNGQPMYRDQWAAMYYKYRVFACKIKLTWMPFAFDVTNAGTPTTVIIACYASDNVTTDTDVTITRQRTGCKAIDSGGSAFTTNKMALKHYSKCAPLLGYGKYQYKTDLNTAGNLSASSSPTTQTYFNVIVQDVSTSAYLNGYLSVQLKYYAKIFDRIENIAAS